MTLEVRTVGEGVVTEEDVSGMLVNFGFLNRMCLLCGNCTRIFTAALIVTAE